MVNNNLYKFIKTNKFSEYEISKFITKEGINHRELLNECFMYLYKYTDINNITNYSISTINNTIDLIVLIINNISIEDVEIYYYKYNIQKLKKHILDFFNKLDIQDDFDILNKLDNIVIKNKNNEEKLIILVKELINKKENINIIKKIINLNKKVIIYNDYYLFDYIFNISIDKIKNQSIDANYYLMLLKIVYSNKINIEKYLKIIGEKNKNNIYIIDLINLLNDNKNQLRNSQILEKYDISLDCIDFKPTFISENLKEDTIISIDANQTSLREDAFSIKKDGNNYIIDIYITDAGKYIIYDSYADRIARQNFKVLSLYGGIKVNLFSKYVSKAFSFDEGKERPAIDLQIVMTNGGTILDYSISERNIIVTRNFTMSACENGLDYKTETGFERTFNELMDIAFLLKNENISSNHVRYKNKSESRSNVLVAEYMILYNTLVAQIAKEKNLDFIYKSQEEQYISDLAKNIGLNIGFDDKIIFDGIYSDSRYTLEPMPHCRLDAMIYSDSSRPFRKYPSLFNQYLLHAQYFNDINMNLSDEDLISYLEYFNLREYELSLLKAEYNDKDKRLSKKR